MRSKLSVGKSVSIVLVVSMISMGTAASIPRAYAASNVENVVSVNSIGTNTLSQLKIINPDGTSTDQNLISGTYQYSLTVKNSISSLTLFLKETNESGPITVATQNATDNSTTPILLTPSETPGEYTTAKIPIYVGDNTIIISVSDGTNVTPYTLKVTREAANSTTGTPSTGTTSPGSSTGTGKPTTGTKTPGSSTSGTSKTRASKPGTSKTGTSKPGTSKTGSYSSSKNKYSSKSISVGNTSNMSSSGASRSQGTSITQKPSTATLSALTLSSGTWNKTFAKDTYTYHITVAQDVDSVTFEDTTTYSGASVTVNGSTSNNIELGNQEKTIVPIVVTNGSDRKTYVLVFNKNIPQSTTATTATADTNTANIQSTSTNFPNNSAYGYQGGWGNRNNNSSSTSWWSRLIDSIKSFFTKL